MAMAETPTPRRIETARVILPPHLGAVLEEGRNIAYAIDPYTQHPVPGIEIRSVVDKEGRRDWMFENMRVFNSLPDAALLWKPAIDDYLRDLETARVNHERTLKTTRDRETFDKKARETRDTMLAMMAISASARAMERCAAVPDLYLKAISLGSEEPLSDAQDYLGSFLLHKDPQKYVTVIKDPLVGYYYQQVLEDAYLTRTKGQDPQLPLGDQDPEWHEVTTTQENKAGETIEKGKWHCSRVIIASTANIRKGAIDSLREEGRIDTNSLIYYFHGDARNGGFETYMRDALLRRDTPRSIKKKFGGNIPYTIRWAAARIACDAFLVDKFARWSFQLTSIDEDGVIKRESDIYDNSLKLAPTRDWGGDPFTNIIQPSFLPRQIKKVYEGEGAQILDMVDKGFRPDDIFFGGDEKLAEKILHPTAVENLKNIIRFNRAVGLFFGSSRAAGVSEYNMRALGDSLKDIGELLAQIYDDKEIVGAMIARLVLAKAEAARSSMVNPPFFVDVFGPLTDPRATQPLREMRDYLFGTKLDWRSGLIANMASQRTKLVFKGNKYGAQKDLELAFERLSGPEESLARKIFRGGVIVSTAMTSKR